MSVQFNRKAVGQHGVNVFYKEFTVSYNTTCKTYRLGSFYFVRKEPNPVTIAEFQLIWTNVNDGKSYGMVKLYFNPVDEKEHTLDVLDGVQEFGEHEVIEADRQVVIECCKFPSWECAHNLWNKTCGEVAFANVPGECLKQLIKEEEGLSKCQEDREVKILSYPGYCRFKTSIEMLKIGLPMTFKGFLARGGIQLENRNTIILFSRWMFSKPQVESFTLTENISIPVFKGRPKKKRGNVDLMINKARKKKMKTEVQLKEKKRKLSNSLNSEIPNVQDMQSSANSAALRILKKYKKKNEKTITDKKDDAIKNNKMVVVKDNAIENELQDKKECNSPDKKEDNQPDKDDMESSIKKARAEDFMRNLCSFMDSRKTPILKIPSVGSAEVDLHDLFTRVMRNSGYAQVTLKRLWGPIYHRLGRHSKLITNAATSTRKIYEKFLLPYENDLRKVGKPNTIQNGVEEQGNSAIDTDSIVKNETSENKIIPENKIKPENKIITENKIMTENKSITENKPVYKKKIMPKKKYIPEKKTILERKIITERKILPKSNPLSLGSSVLSRDLNFIQSENKPIPPESLVCSNVLPGNHALPINNVLSINNVTKGMNFVRDDNKPIPPEAILVYAENRSPTKHGELKNVVTPRNREILPKGNVFPNKSARTRKHDNSVSRRNAGTPDNCPSFTLQAGEAFKLMIQKRRGRPSKEFRQQIEQLKTMNRKVEVEVYPPIGKRTKLPTWLNELNVDIVNPLRKKNKLSVTGSRRSVNSNVTTRHRHLSSDIESYRIPPVSNDSPLSYVSTNDGQNSTPTILKVESLFKPPSNRLSDTAGGTSEEKHTNLPLNAVNNGDNDGCEFQIESVRSLAKTKNYSIHKPPSFIHYPTYSSSTQPIIIPQSVLTYNNEYVPNSVSISSDGINEMPKSTDSLYSIATCISNNGYIPNHVNTSYITNETTKFVPRYSICPSVSNNDILRKEELTKRVDNNSTLININDVRMKTSSSPSYENNAIANIPQVYYTTNRKRIYTSNKESEKDTTEVDTCHLGEVFIHHPSPHKSPIKKKHEPITHFPRNMNFRPVRPAPKIISGNNIFYHTYRPPPGYTSTTTNRCEQIVRTGESNRVLTAVSHAAVKTRRFTQSEPEVYILPQPAVSTSQFPPQHAWSITSSSSM